jgi:hypothetical protein
MQTIQAAMTSRILSTSIRSMASPNRRKGRPNQGDFSGALAALTVRDITHRQKENPRPVCGRAGAVGGAGEAGESRAGPRQRTR